MKLVFPRLYVIMDAALLALYGERSRTMRPHAEGLPSASGLRVNKSSERAAAEMLRDAGVELIQYRHKQIPSRDLFRISQDLVGCLSASGGRGVRFIVNDRPDVAALAGADGVHVGQEDLPVEDARRVCGPKCWVGVSTHTLEQVAAADGTSADYVAVGPIFPTTTKERPDPVVGLEFIQEARKLTRKPLVAIGGITLDRAEEVFRAGADSIAVARDLFSHEDLAARAREFLSVAAQVAAQNSKTHTV